MRSLTERPSASDISVTLIRFGRKRRLVLMFEWLPLWPDRGPFPVSSQRRDMVEILEWPAEGRQQNGPFRGRGTYKVSRKGRQASGIGGRAADSSGESSKRRDLQVNGITDSTHSDPMTRWTPPARGGFAAVPGEGLVLRRYFALGALALASLPGVAHAQTKLEARYAVTLAGIPLGSGTWVIDLAADGAGTPGSKGTLQGANVISSGYVASMISDKRADEVRMTMGGGAVKTYVAIPPLEPSPERVPLTEAHRKGVVDPMSAGLMPVPGKGELLTPDACKRKLAIFDGRTRVDIDLVYKRMDHVKADKGYQGAVVVCQVLYRPIAGHRPERSAIKYLVEQRDMEMWLAPIDGTRVLVPFRFSVPTPFGIGVLQANYFVANPLPTQALRQTPTSAKRSEERRVGEERRS